MAGADLTPLIVNYWAKARPPADAERAWHPFLWHALDVAACAEAILDQHTALRDRLRRLAGGRDLAELVRALALVHDLGKLSRFQEQAPEAVRAATGQTHHRPEVSDRLRHTDAGLVLWQAHVTRTLDLDLDANWALDVLMPGVLGHHGVPADGHGERARNLLRSATDAADRAAAGTLAQWALTDFAGAGSPDEALAGVTALDDAALGRLSFLVAAVVNLADWLGSDAARFPYTAPDRTADAYWTQVARPAARAAVAGSGVIPREPAAQVRFADLFPARAPRPLQAFADAMPLPEEQGLVLVEDVTGSGKTEAADVLAARMTRAGLGRGVYIALPTTATAERMAERHRGLHTRLTDGTEPGSLTLVHGAPGSAGVVDAGTAEARAWMGGDRRRQLMADVAVGTVDQALLAALPARFASARLFGLAPKVLVVDEVHAHDAYTGELLVGLLRLHAALGGSAVLLSATLTADLKQRFARAFAEGAGWPAPDPAPLGTGAYPAVTVVDEGGARAHAVDAHAGAHRRIPARLTDDGEAVRAHLLGVARAGGCALWMRNTVDDAVSAYDALAAEHADVTLVHARFPAARRSELEDAIVRRFGPDSRATDRAGAIVVATQVLEQSLDLDFDAMVADLKPMDALLQSAGRLQRHPRAANGDPRGPAEPDGRDPATLWVHGPAFDPDPPADWYKAPFPLAAYVYPQIGWLWRTAELIAARGELRQPDELRDLIETALPADDPGLPTGICAAADDALAAALAERSHARDKLLRPERGYTRTDGQWRDDMRVPTRLGDSVELCLVRVDQEGEWQPWGAAGYPDGFLRVPANRVADLRAHRAADPRAQARKEADRRLAWRAILPLAWDDDRACWRLPESTTGGGCVVYDRFRGLMFTRSA